MKFRFILILMFVCQIIHARSGGLNISGYSIHANLDMSKRQLLIGAQMHFRKDDPLRSVTLLLSHHAVISSIRSGDQAILPFHISGKDTLVITLPGKLANSKTITLSCSYSLPVDSFMVSRGMIVMKRFECWYPRQNFELSGSSVKIRVPDNLVTISNGTFSRKPGPDHTTVFNWKTKSTYNLAMFIFNPDSMECRSDVVAGTRINYYFVPGYKDEQRVISQARNSFLFYSDYLGKYQQDTFSVIEIPSDDFLGQALKNLLLFTSKLPEYIPDPGLWVPHEVGHQWFGHTVIADDLAPGHWFVEESINEYLRAMYVERVYGPDSLKRILEKVYLANYHAIVKTGKEVPIMDVVSVNDSPEEAQAIYAWGPIVLHQLRRCMGEVAWNTFLKKVYHDFKNKMLTLDDFKLYLAEYDPGGKCLKLLNTLLNAGEIPEGLSFN